MKTFFLITRGMVALACALAFPVFASAAITYTRAPSGTAVTSPVAVTVTSGDFSEFGMPTETISYNVRIEEYNGERFFQGTCFLPSETVASTSFVLPTALSVGQIYMIPYDTDNCSEGNEISQYDLEGDMSGVVFTVASDEDNDGIFNDSDNCPLAENSNQADNDGDGAGDICDFDDDNDGVNDESTETEEGVTPADNCPLTANADQIDADNDGIGDACDDTALPPPPSSSGGSLTFDYWGCTDSNATNFNSLANKDDGSCQLPASTSVEDGDATPSSLTAAPPQGEVLGATTEEPSLFLTITPPVGEVLGAAEESTPALSAACVASPYLRDNLRRGRKNDPEQVKLLQTFLNEEMNAGIPITGFFGHMTHASVKKFQVKHREDILKPWIDAGYGDRNFNANGTGYVYKTTKRAINMMKCAEIAEPMPELVLDTSAN